MTIPDAHSTATVPPIHVFGAFRYDAVERLLTRDGAEVALPPRVIGVLHVLLEHHGRIVSKPDLIEAVWGRTFVTETSLTEAISLLRQALGDEPQSPSFVQTVHRRGYRFVAPVTRVEREQPVLTGPGRIAAAASMPEAEAPAVRTRRDLRIAGVAAAIVILLAAAAVVAGLRARAPRQDGARPTHLAIAMPQETTLVEWMPSIAISPDGRDIVFAARRGEETMLHHRSLDGFETRVLEGTEGASTPFFSPDGQWLGFVTQGALLKMKLSGGVPITLCKAEWPMGAAWSADGSIVFGSALGGLRRVSENGGTPVAVTRPDAARGEVMHVWPELLPDGRSLLFTIFANTISSSKVALLSLDTGERKLLLESAAGARYASNGYLMYARPDAIVAVGFDATSRRVTGSPVALFRDVAVHPFAGFLQLATSRNGTLVYMPYTRALPPRRLARLSANGKVELLKAPPRYYRNLEIAPDRVRAAVTILEAGRSDVWIMGLETGSLQRMTFDGFNIEPVWSPDGEWIYYSSNRAGPYNVYRRRANGHGAAERVMTSARHQYPYFWSPDGRHLIYGEAAEGTGFDLWVAEPAAGWKTTPFLRTPALEATCEISPDGKWLAYESDASGAYEIYVRAFPGGDGHRQISNAGGVQPFWSDDGKTLYYHDQNRIVAVAFGSGTLSDETVLEGNEFDLAQRGTAGARLTLIHDTEPLQHPTELRVILGWESLLDAQRSGTPR